MCCHVVGWKQVQFDNTFPQRKMGSSNEGKLFWSEEQEIESLCKKIVGVHDINRKR